MSGGSSRSRSSGRQFQQEAQSPFFMDLYGQAQGVSQDPRSFFPGQNYASMSGSTQQGIQGFQQLAAGGQGSLDAASGYSQDVLSGKFLNSNPYLDATLLWRRYFGR